MSALLESYFNAERRPESRAHPALDSFTVRPSGWGGSDFV